MSTRLMTACRGRAIERDPDQEVSVDRQRLVLVSLADRANDATGLAWPAVRTLSTDTGIPTGAVRRALVLLSEQGLIRPEGVRSRGGRPTTWRILPDVELAPAPEEPARHLAGNENPNPPGTDHQPARHRPPTRQAPGEEAVEAEEEAGGGGPDRAVGDDAPPSTTPPPPPEQQDQEPTVTDVVTAAVELIADRRVAAKVAQGGHVSTRYRPSVVAGVTREHATRLAELFAEDPTRTPAQLVDLVDGPGRQQQPKSWYASATEGTAAAQLAAMKRHAERASIPDDAVCETCYGSGEDLDGDCAVIRCPDCDGSGLAVAQAVGAAR